MRKKTKTLFALLGVILFIYVFTFIFASDVFEILVPFYELPRDCGKNCAG